MNKIIIIPTESSFSQDMAAMFLFSELLNKLDNGVFQDFSNKTKQFSQSCKLQGRYVNPGGVVFSWETVQTLTVFVWPQGLLFLELDNSLILKVMHQKVAPPLFKRSFKLSFTLQLELLQLRYLVKVYQHNFSCSKLSHKPWNCCHIKKILCLEIESDFKNLTINFAWRDFSLPKFHQSVSSTDQE